MRLYLIPRSRGYTFRVISPKWAFSWQWSSRSTLMKAFHATFLLLVDVVPYGTWNWPHGRELSIFGVRYPNWGKKRFFYSFSVETDSQKSFFYPFLCPVSEVIPPHPFIKNFPALLEAWMPFRPANSRICKLPRNTSVSEIFSTCQGLRPWRGTEKIFSDLGQRISVNCKVILEGNLFQSAHPRTWLSLGKEYVKVACFLLTGT